MSLGRTHLLAGLDFADGVVQLAPNSCPAIPTISLIICQKNKLRQQHNFANLLYGEMQDGSLQDLRDLKVITLCHYPSP
ncbi:hypothetical protein TcasGA2_TC032026 [Tribolium castaneum]|uniref:Uncharacterized protein n=1 Tax=Tribolium castaneum TaxID=7070 RepID=A0A139WNP0_TRICA|nr:hypothetical protein TcasGA2_TC032026 [Tribolium castaneum]